MGWLGKDIDEDLTGDVPQLSVGMDTLEQRLPQWLRRVRPQVAPGPGQGERGPVNCFLFWGPVRDRGWCEGPPHLDSAPAASLVPSPPAFVWHSGKGDVGSSVGPHGDALCAHSTQRGHRSLPPTPRVAVGGSKGCLPAWGGQVDTSPASMASPQPSGNAEGLVGAGSHGMSLGVGSGHLKKP